MTKGELQYSLEDQALSLVQKVRDTPSAAHEQELIDWRGLSPEHARAVERAERLLTIARTLPADLSRPTDRWVVPLQRSWLRLQENRFRLSYVFVAGLLVAALAFWQTPRGVPPDTVAKVAAVEMPIEYETARGQRREVVLDDGSTLWLDWRSRVTVQMAAGERRVTLHRGAGAFNVVSDASRPFVVDAAGVTTRVTGTEFVVRHLGNPGVEVAVLEGSVRVDAATTGHGVDLEAGQAVVGQAGSFAAVVSRPVEELGAWRDGLLVFTDRPLLEVLRVLEPYTSYRLETGELYDTSRTVTGTFPVDRADASLRTLLVNHNIEADLISHNTLVLRHLPPSRPR